MNLADSNTASSITHKLGWLAESNAVIIEAGNAQSILP